MNNGRKRLECMQGGTALFHLLLSLCPEMAGVGSYAGYGNLPTALGTWLVLSIVYKPIALAMTKPRMELLKTLQTQLIGAASYINGAKKVYNLIRNNKVVTNNFDSIAALRSLAEPTTTNSDEFNELIELLNTSTFKGKPSSFSMPGRILRAYALISKESVQKELTAITKAIGEIDVYIGLAQKIRSTAGKNAQYSFVEFDTTSATPYIKATGLWNPFVPESKAIANSIEMGGDKPRNIILSGPNTGGKSTLSKSVMLNLILAQVFGIAAAKHMRFTPFANLDCFMNMTDDTASGVSGWQAEANRAEAIIKAVESKPQDFHFLLLDEIFTATSPDQAEKVAVGFIKYLSELPNCMFIDAAHFDGIKDFADKSKDCRNCHMGAITDTNGKVLKYTYKLAEGRSTIKNAAQVATATGKLSFLQDAAATA